MSKAQNNSGAKYLLSAFTSGCKSYSTWTEAALSQTQSLESIVSELKSKTDCSGLNGALTNAQSLADEIKRIAEDPIQSKLKESQEVKRQLLIELQLAT